METPEFVNTLQALLDTLGPVLKVTLAIFLVISAIRIMALAFRVSDKKEISEKDQKFLKWIKEKDNPYRWQGFDDRMK